MSQTDLFDMEWYLEDGNNEIKIDAQFFLLPFLPGWHLRNKQCQQLKENENHE